MKRDLVNKILDHFQLRLDKLFVSKLRIFISLISRKVDLKASDNEILAYIITLN